MTSLPRGVHLPPLQTLVHLRPGALQRPEDVTVAVWRRLLRLFALQLECGRFLTVRSNPTDHQDLATALEAELRAVSGDDGPGLRRQLDRLRRRVLDPKLQVAVPSAQFQDLGVVTLSKHSTPGTLPGSRTWEPFCHFADHVPTGGNWETGPRQVGDSDLDAFVRFCRPFGYLRIIDKFAGRSLVELNLDIERGRSPEKIGLGKLLLRLAAQPGRRHVSIYTCLRVVHNDRSTGRRIELTAELLEREAHKLQPVLDSVGPSLRLVFHGVDPSRWGLHARMATGHTDATSPVIAAVLIDGGVATFENWRTTHITPVDPKFAQRLADQVCRR